MRQASNLVHNTEKYYLTVIEEIEKKKQKNNLNEKELKWAQILNWRLPKKWHYLLY